MSMFAGLFVLIALYIGIMFFINAFYDQMAQETGFTLKKSSAKLAVTILIGFLMGATIVTKCYQRINPGEVGVVVNLFGSHKGVEDEELHVGYHFIKPWCNVYRFPIFEQNHQWTGGEGFNFQTSEGLSVHADIGITFNLEPEYIHELFAKYRRGMDEITHMFIRNNIRDAINKAASKMKIEDLYGPSKELFFNTIQTHLREELQPLGFNINHLYIIGQFQVPAEVMAALNKKIEAVQRAQQRENELREAEAEARKQVAKVEGEAQAKVLAAEAEAKSAALLSKTITPQMLRLEWIRKWDGKLPQYMGKDMSFILNNNEGAA